MVQIEKLTAKPDQRDVGRDSHDAPFDRFRVTSVQQMENSQIKSPYALRRWALADALASESYVFCHST